MRLARTLMIAFMAAILLCSCSNNDENPESGKIDTMTKEAAQEAAQMIKTPLEKAQAAADQEAKRVREIDERTNQ